MAVTVFRWLLGIFWRSQALPATQPGTSCWVAGAAAGGVSRELRCFSLALALSGATGFLVPSTGQHCYSLWSNEQLWFQLLTPDISEQNQLCRSEVPEQWAAVILSRHQVWLCTQFMENYAWVRATGIAKIQILPSLSWKLLMVF